MKTHGAKRDKNEPLIVDALRFIGATVRHLSDSGIPDLLVGYQGHTFLIEVKDEKGKLTTAQEDFIKLWTGYPIIIAVTPEDAIEAVRKIVLEG